MRMVRPASIHKWADLCWPSPGAPCKRKRKRVWCFLARPFIFLIPSLFFSGVAFMFTFKYSLDNDNRISEKPSFLVDCSFNASHHELVGSRYENIPDEAVTMLDSSPFLRLPLLKNSICDDQSIFFSQHNLMNVRVWAARLLYLTIHEHQYGQARHEYQRQMRCPSSRPQYNDSVSKSNFSCPHAKFLVLSLQNNGIGANLRLGAVPALMASLATDRVLLLVNNAVSGASFLQEPWALASCSRRDAQCAWRPLSPCTLSHDALESAHILTRPETRQLFRWGKVPDDRERDRVLVLHFNFRPQRQPENLPQVLYRKSQATLERLQHSFPARTQKVLQQAVELILQEPVNNGASNFSYYGVGSVIFHSMLLFLLRPNRSVSAQVERHLAEMFPSNFVPEESIGLPIRGSDKCGVESECLTFPQYVQAAKEAWINESPLTSIVVTTESRRVIREQKEWADSFPFRFLLNHNDVTQNTGYVRDIVHANNITADDAMISALSSLKAQLRTGFTLGNCCSNFHLLLKDLLSVGCGASPTLDQFQCLQEHANPEFRVCCAWDKSERCELRRQGTTEHRLLP